jgi:acyl-CoA synthetase (AMP-forming)/AMP-acid ligase II
MGIDPGDRVGILAYNCIEYVIIYYAIAKCGGIVVPLNFRYKKDELTYTINTSNPKVLFFAPDFISLVKNARTDFVSSLHLVAISGEPLESGLTLTNLMKGQTPSEPSLEVNPSSPCTILYTSGTTGFPKGVLMSHQAWLSTYTGEIVEGDVHHDDISLVCMPLFHGGGMHVLLQPTLVKGGTAVIMEKGFDPDKFLSAVNRYNITLTLLVPTQLAMLVNYPGSVKYNISTLKKIWYGSSPISPTVIEASMDLLKVGFYQWYGQTETGMISVLRPEDHRDRSQCTGRELFNADLRVVDGKGQDTPLGEVGEIISAQNHAGMIGYHKLEEATQETIKNGWIYTGDLAMVDGDGYFTIVGRSKDMIISGAENVYPKEIEDVLINHPGVCEAVVIGIPDEIWGESVCAIVVTKEGYKINEAEIIEFCVKRLSGYKKPKKVVFMSELPKNAAGKVTKNVLREPFWAGRKKKI